MHEEPGWVQEMLALIADAQHERDEAERERLRVEQRLAQAARSVEAANHKITAFRMTLDALRSKYKLVDPEAETVDAAEARRYQGLSPKEMVRLWTETHRGEIRVNDASEYLASIGLFRDKTQAAGTLYPTITRLPEEFERVGRGVFHRRSSLAPPSSATTEDGSEDEPGFDFSVDDDDADEGQPDVMANGSSPAGFWELNGPSDMMRVPSLSERP